MSIAINARLSQHELQLRRQICSHLRRKHRGLWLMTIAQVHSFDYLTRRKAYELSMLGFRRGSSVLILSPRGLHAFLSLLILDRGEQPNDAQLRSLNTLASEGHATWVTSFDDARLVIDAYAELGPGDVCDVRLHPPSDASTARLSRAALRRTAPSFSE